MRLDDIKWAPHNFGDDYRWADVGAHLVVRSTFEPIVWWVFPNTSIAKFKDTKNPYPDNGWERVDELTAQCVLYELLEGSPSPIATT